MKSSLRGCLLFVFFGFLAGSSIQANGTTNTTLTLDKIGSKPVLPATLVPISTQSPEISTNNSNVTTISLSQESTTTDTTTIDTTTIDTTTTPSTTDSTTLNTNPTTKTTVTPPPSSTPTATTTTTAPPVPCHHFDGPSFIGGIVLTLGLLAIGIVAYKFYKAHNERNYHIL